MIANDFLNFTAVTPDSQYVPADTPRSIPLRYPIPRFRTMNPTAYTPLKVNQQGEYNIEVSTIKINEKIVLTKQDFNGTIISAATPYTILEHSLFATFTRFFANQFSKLCRLSGCVLTQQNFRARKSGLEFPTLILFCMTATLCGGFFEQTRLFKHGQAWHLEDNLLQFDLAQSRLGFSSSLLSKHTSCAKFNFTSTP
ncbi:hypothetical protein HYC85_016238 [Camellia sinensis]|uniref:Xylanase inhibitor C-terminal domain-containing protein n=1 Tax=Camellia sinensis TaxID=4442 RepID=A0A7J7GZA8_CAMSI|nr:hypothetical protein HYC85_016238 [Camellia sinensis]